jgi:hypothetical protein
MSRCVPSFFAHTANHRSFNPSCEHNIPPCPTKVSRRLLKDTGEHKREDVLINYGREYQNSDPILMAAMINKLDEERKEVRDWATDEIKMKMLKRACTLNMRYRNERVNKFQDIVASWKETPSPANAKKLYLVLFGDYEARMQPGVLIWKQNS